MNSNAPDTYRNAFDDKGQSRRIIAPPAYLLGPQVTQDAFREQDVLLEGRQRQGGKVLPL